MVEETARCCAYHAEGTGSSVSSKYPRPLRRHLEALNGTQLWALAITTRKCL